MPDTPGSAITGHSTKPSRMQVGETWIMFIPPGWILAGTIVDMDDDEVVFNDAVYLEGCAQNHALLSSIPRARPEHMKDVCPTAWGLPDGYVIRREAILHAGKCQHSVKSLVTQKDVENIKGTR